MAAPDNHVQARHNVDIVDATSSPSGSQPHSTTTPGSPFSAPPRREIAGKYKVLAQLGHGGMATAYLAIQTGLAEFRKFVVVKRMHAGLSQDAAFCEMFLHEARLAACLHHPNIVDTYEVGVDQDCYFLAMEYVRGVALERVTQQLGVSGPFTIPMYLKILSDVLAALSYAYDEKDVDGRPLLVVHRDVSPQNIIVSSIGSAKLVDFGVAKAAFGTSHTASGVIKGKVKYMAPEQALGGTVDNRSDIYSVGLLLWETLAGKRYYGSKNNITVLSELIGSKPISPIRAEERGLPPFADEVVAKAMALHPDDRYQHADEFRRDLVKLAQMLGGVAADSDIAQVLLREFAEDARRLEETIELAKTADASSTIPRYHPAKETSNSEVSVIETTGAATLAEAVPSLRNKPDGRPEAAGSNGSSVGASSVAVPSATSRTTLARSRTVVVIPAFFALLVLAGGTAWLLKRAGSGSSGIEAATASASSPSVPSSVTISFGATPPSARIYLDGAELKSNPAVIIRPASSQRHTIVVEAPGHESKRGEMTFEQNARISVDLRRIAAPAPSADTQQKQAVNKRRPPPARRTRPAAAASSPPTSPATVSTPAAKSLDEQEPW